MLDIRLDIGHYSEEKQNGIGTIYSYTHTKQCITFMLSSANFWNNDQISYAITIIGCTHFNNDMHSTG